MRGLPPPLGNVVDLSPLPHMNEFFQMHPILARITSRIYSSTNAPRARPREQPEIVQGSQGRFHLSELELSGPQIHALREQEP